MGQKFVEKGTSSNCLAGVRILTGQPDWSRLCTAVKKLAMNKYGRETVNNALHLFFKGCCWKSCNRGGREG